MRFVKIYGDQNSGTVYLEWLLRKNLDATLLDSYDFGWKHRIAPLQDELTDNMKSEVVFLCLVKNPYSWLVSMHKRPYFHESLKKINFIDFLTYSMGDYRNPVVRWNLKNESYLKMGNYVKHHQVIRYEDILSNPAETVNAIAEKYMFNKPHFFKNISNLITNSHGMKQQKFHKDYYLNEEWKNKFHLEHIQQINPCLDKNLMETFHYSFI
jgi:hypothetical protein